MLVSLVFFADTSSKQPLFDEQFNSQTERLSSSSYENTE